MFLLMLLGSRQQLTKEIDLVQKLVRNGSEEVHFNYKYVVKVHNLHRIG